jgi:hypothetical protein
MPECRRPGPLDGAGHLGHAGLIPVMGKGARTQGHKTRHYRPATPFAGPFTVFRATRLVALALVVDAPTMRERHVEQRHSVAPVLGTGMVFGTRSHQHPPLGLQVIEAPHSGQMALSFIDPEASTR